MSTFDPRTPSHVPPGGALDYDGSAYAVTESNQTPITLFGSVTISATTIASSITNRGARGAIFILDITGIPGSASTTVALKLQTVVPRTATFASRAAVSSSGTAVFMVYPGISASIGGVSCPLPHSFNALLSVSAGATNKDITLSLTMMRID